MMKFSTIVRYCLVLGLAAGALALAPAASAAPDDEQLPHGTLQTAGVDFTSPKAVSRLQGRLRHTAFDICAADAYRRAMYPDERKCFETAISDGNAQIENRRMLAMGQSKVKVAETDPNPAH